MPYSWRAVLLAPLLCAYTGIGAENGDCLEVPVGEYTDLDDGQVKLYPHWLTPGEAARIHVLVEYEGARAS